MKIKRLWLSRKNIREGRLGDSKKCPLALMLSDKLGGHWNVGSENYWQYKPFEGYMYGQKSQMLSIRRAFDSGEQIKPQYVWLNVEIGADSPKSRNNISL